jgi:hypothetical protein
LKLFFFENSFTISFLSEVELFCKNRLTKQLQQQLRAWPREKLLFSPFLYESTKKRSFTHEAVLKNGVWQKIVHKTHEAVSEVVPNGV